MKPTVTICICILAAGLALAQSPTIIQSTRATMQGVSNNATAATNEALGINQPAPKTAIAVHTPAKSSGAAVVSVKPAAGGSASAKKAKRAPVVGVKPSAPKPAEVAPKKDPVAAVAPAASSGSSEAETAANEQSVVPDSKNGANGRRDPFISPVVSHAGGSGCSTGKKCLEIGTINLRGVVHAESGFIAVVSNGLNKAYFLRENDPVFNGYVVKITGDSIVFQETLQDRMGKSFTREVTKKITTPAV